jgi:hypothetical protein
VNISPDSKKKMIQSFLTFPAPVLFAIKVTFPFQKFHPFKTIKKPESKPEKSGESDNLTFLY